MAGVKRETLDKKKNNGCVGNRTVGGNVFLCKSDWIKTKHWCEMEKVQTHFRERLRLAILETKWKKIFTNQA